MSGAEAPSGWANTTLPDTFSIEQVSVDGTALGLQFVQVLAATLAEQVTRIVDHRLDPQRPAVLEVLLDPSEGPPAERGTATVDIGA
jgi:hypothetical protein